MNEIRITSRIGSSAPMTLADTLVSVLNLIIHRNLYLRTIQMSIAGVAKKGRDFNLFHVRMQDRIVRDKLFSLTDNRPFTPNEILGTAQGVKIFAEWAPKTELFWRNRGYGEPAGLWGLSSDRSSF